MSTKRHVISHLTLKEISAVDMPAQIGARMSIMKRATTAVEQIAKSLTADAPKSFADVLVVEQREQARWRIQDKLWPLYDALRTSISNTVADATMNDAAQLSQIEANVEQFLGAVRAELPELEEDVTKALLAFAVRKSAQPGDDTMTKTVEQLTAELATSAASVETLTKSLAAVTFLSTLSDADRDVVLKMSKKDKEEFDGMDEDGKKKAIKKARDGDETLTVDGVTVTKSGVGEASFAMLKAMSARQALTDEQLTKAADANLELTLKSRIATEFAKLPGTDAEKLDVLKAASKLPEAQRLALEGMLKSGNAALSGAFGGSGTSAGNPAPAGGTSQVIKSAEKSLDEKTTEIMKSRGITKRNEAYAAALAENPDLAAAINGE